MKKLKLSAFVLSIAIFSLSNEAIARCDSVKSCTLSDFKTAAGQQGCDLLFVESRYSNCISARKTLHGPTACGGRIDGVNYETPGACASRQDNKAILSRWTKCLTDRETQKDAFTSGLADIEKARRDFSKAKDYKDIKEFLSTINTRIEQAQPAHDEEIRGVKNSIANCKKFVQN